MKYAIFQDTRIGKRPYQQDRIKVFLNPAIDPRGKGYNTLFAGKLVDGRIEGTVRISDGESYKTIPWKATR